MTNKPEETTLNEKPVSAVDAGVAKSKKAKAKKATPKKAASKKAPAKKPTAKKSKPKASASKRRKPDKPADPIPVAKEPLVSLVDEDGELKPPGVIGTEIRKAAVLVRDRALDAMSEPVKDGIVRAAGRLFGMFDGALEGAEGGTKPKKDDDDDVHSSVANGS